MLTGYAGKIGWVDLTAETTRIDGLDEDMARKCVFGTFALEGEDYAQALSAIMGWDKNGVPIHLSAGRSE